MLGSPMLYIKGMRILMFQLSGFYYREVTNVEESEKTLETQYPRPCKEGENLSTRTGASKYHT